MQSNSSFDGKLRAPTAREIQQDEYARDFADTCCNQYREAIILANENMTAALEKKDYLMSSTWLNFVQKLEDKLATASIRRVVIDIQQG